MTDGTPISFQAAVRGTPVLSSSGKQIGTLEHVLEVSELDIFEGIVIATRHGLRFVDADRLPEFTTTHIRSSLDDEEAAKLPPPQAALEARHRLGPELTPQDRRRLCQRWAVPGEVTAAHQGGGDAGERLGTVDGAEPVRLIGQDHKASARLP